MSYQQRIHDKLVEAFSPQHLEVINESHGHNVPAGSESHFKVVVISSAFEGQMLIKRQRAVNKALEEELEAIHALAQVTLTPDEWQAKGGVVPKSPPCMGGSK